MLKYLLPASIIWLCMMIGASANDSYKPTYLPQMTTFKAKGPIIIDGEINDQGWIGLPRATGFAEHRPGDQTEPPVRTEAMLTYNDDNLYIAFICYDDPKTIRANHSDRDKMWQDDNVILLLDTYGNASWAYEIGVNPLGVQGDIIWSQYGGEDTSPELIWESAGKITDSGYQVEMAIPFSSLRFPNKKEQVWKVDFWRNHPRDSRRQYSWAAYDRNIECWPCKWGTVTGIKDIKPPKGIEFLPSLLSYQNGYLNDPYTNDFNWHNEDIDGEFSLGGKYTPTSNLAIEATYNPDFSQIEADEAQIDVNSSFALFYTEKRPFFQEGSDLFHTWIDAIYTRTINNPNGAVKAVGRTDKTSIYVLSAYDEDSPLTYPQKETTVGGIVGKSYSNIARVRHSIGEQSHIGGLLTDRRYDGGGYSTTYGIDAAFYFLKHFDIKVQGLQSSTEEMNDPNANLFYYNDVVGQDYFGKDSFTTALDGENFRGHSLYASLERSSRNWWFDIDYSQSSPTFRADNGFITQCGDRYTEINTGYTYHYDTKIFDYISANGGYGRKWDYDNGHFKDEWIWYELNNQLKAQTFVYFGGMYSHETFGGIHFDDIFNFTLMVNSRFSDLIQFGMQGDYGHRIARTIDPPILANEANFNLWMILKPTRRLKISPTYTYFKNVDRRDNKVLNEGYILYNRFDYNLSKNIISRLIVQYNDFGKSWTIDPLLTYRLSSYSVFYIGSSHRIRNYDNYKIHNDNDETIGIINAGSKQSNRQFFMKLQYLFRI